MIPDKVILEAVAGRCEMRIHKGDACFVVLLDELLEGNVGFATRYNGVVSLIRGALGPIHGIGPQYQLETALVELVGAAHDAAVAMGTPQETSTARGIV